MPVQRFLIPLLSFAISACTLNQAPPQTEAPLLPSAAVSENIPAAQQVVQQPTATSAPTIAPEILLQAADTQLLNGYFENAVFNYRAILDQGTAAPDYLRAAAAFNLGQAALREGLFNDGVQALTTLLTQFPQDSRAAQAYFLRGDAYLGIGDWQAAINDFQQYLALRPGLIDSYAYERIADGQLALGQTDAALASYGLALTANRSLVPLLALREKVARIYISLGRISDAVAQYDLILSVAQNAPYRADIDYQAAKTLLDSGDSANGLSRMRRVFDTYRETQTAYSAMESLLANGVEIDSLTEGKVRFNFGDYQGAINAFNLYTTQYQLAAIPAELYLLLGRAYREIGNPGAAIIAFQTIIEQYPQDPLFGDALLEQGRTRFLSNDIPGAIETYLNIANTYNYLGAASAEALWRAGYLYGTNGNPTASRETFVKLADAYPNTEQATSGLFIAASAAVNSQEWLIAENLYSRLATLSTGENQAAAYLWVGRLALQRGDQSIANDVLARAVSAAPDSYFAARASDILINRPPFQKPSAFIFQFDDAADLAAAENWLRQTFGIVQEGDLWPLSPNLEADPRLIRGRELRAVGAYRESDEEFSSLLDESRENKNVLASYQLAIYLRSIGAYRESIIAAADVIRAGGVATQDAPRYLARMRYPAYYLDVVQSVGAEFDLDPLLMFSLIRHESLFNTHATAAAGEKGLTQVIPSTGQYIAEQLNWPDYQHSDLFRPFAGITFGAFYLAEQLGRFDGNTIAALAGYNAGPGRASDWLTLSGGDPDLFMTTITISSTQLYVERIYSFYNIYRLLYGAG